MAADDVVALSDKTNVGMPVRNLIGLIGAVCVGAWAFFGIQERLNIVETNQILMQADVTKNSTFVRDWPLGKAGSLPQDSEQFMLIEHLSGQLTKMQEQLDNMMHNKVNILRLQFYYGYYGMKCQCIKILRSILGL